MNIRVLAVQKLAKKWKKIIVKDFRINISFLILNEAQVTLQSLYFYPYVPITQLLMQLIKYELILFLKYKETVT